VALKPQLPDLVFLTKTVTARSVSLAERFWQRHKEDAVLSVHSFSGCARQSSVNFQSLVPAECNFTLTDHLPKFRCSEGLVILHKAS